MKITTILMMIMLMIMMPLLMVGSASEDPRTPVELGLGLVERLGFSAPRPPPVASCPSGGRARASGVRTHGGHGSVGRRVASPRPGWRGLWRVWRLPRRARPRGARNLKCRKRKSNSTTVARRTRPRAREQNKITAPHGTSHLSRHAIDGRRGWSHA